MLIEFTVGNYRSFAEPATLSMVAANLKSKDKQLDANNTFQLPGQPTALASAAVYGANASGKSNLISALRFMRKFVISSTHSTSATGKIDVEPYLLSTAAASQPSHFEIVFVVAGQRYRYGFDVDHQQVVAEWLYHVPAAREARLFERQFQAFTTSDAFREGRDVVSKTRPNALFLSVAAAFNGEIALRVVDWFRTVGIHSGLNDRALRQLTERRLQQEHYAKQIVELVRRLDVGIEDIRLVDDLSLLLSYLEDQLSYPDAESDQNRKRVVKEVENLLREERSLGGMPLFRASLDEKQSALQEELAPVVPEVAQELPAHALQARSRPSSSIVTIHSRYDKDGNVVGQATFDLDRHESEGTKKLFALAGYLVEVLQKGSVLIVDELDARLHPIVTRELVKLFSDRDSNPNHAQLIFTTQDTNLLDKDLLRRDQIWFVEKDSQGASHLYSLAEFKGIRNDLSLERHYIQGRFGAIPYLRGLTTIATENEPDNGE